MDFASLRLADCFMYTETSSALLQPPLASRTFWTITLQAGGQCECNSDDEHREQRRERLLPEPPQRSYQGLQVTFEPALHESSPRATTMDGSGGGTSTPPATRPPSISTRRTP